MQIKIENWPYNLKAAFCLNFDDLSPFYFAGYDFGGNLKGDLIKQQEYLLNHSNIKITHFVVPKSNFFLPISNKTHKIINFRTNKFALNNEKNLDWLNYFRNLINDDKVEIAMHGFRHFNNHYYKRHQEFYYDNYDEIKQKLLASKKMFEDAGIKVFGFRQPGWGIDKNFNLIKVLKELNFEYIAASSFNAGLNWEEQRVDNFMPSWYQGILNIPQNIELDSSLDDIYKKIDLIVREGNLISIKGHFTNVKWITNNFRRNNFDKLKNIVSYLKQYKIWYATFKDIADYFKIINKASIEKEYIDQRKIFIITLPKKIKGFTITVKSDMIESPYEEIYSDNSKLVLNSGNNYNIVFNVSSDNFIIEY